MIASLDVAAFRSAKPFPHLVLDDMLPAGDAEALLEHSRELSGRGGWVRYQHVNERKRGWPRLDLLPEPARVVCERMTSTAFLRELSRLVDVELVADADGAGLYEMGPGGRLNVHVDFIAHRLDRHLRRRLNLILFLERWPADYGGELELWPDDMSEPKRISPAPNRAVIFETTRRSWHGVSPVSLEAVYPRRTLALYYYERVPELQRAQATRYRPRPWDSLSKRALMALDQLALEVYARVKRATGLSDARAGQAMGLGVLAAIGLALILSSAYMILLAVRGDCEDGRGEPAICAWLDAGLAR